MSEPVSRLPARPSLDQLRKQAKERLRAMRVEDASVTLAAAQYAVARDYGFASWPRLVHHVESLEAAGRLDLYESLARDYLAAYAGDTPALERLGAHFGDSYGNEQRLERVRDRVNSLQGRSAEPTLDDTRLLIARQFGFDTWAALVLSLAQPRGGTDATPPFYRIDAERNVIEPRAPLTDRDWDAVFDVMEERRITGISTSALTDSAARRLAKLDFVTRIHAGGARALTDDGVLHLTAMPQLEDLELGGWHCPLTDRALEVLRHLPNLRSFNMGWAQRISDAGTAHLAFCDRIESVNLMGTPTGDGTLNALRGKRALHRFNTGKQVTDRGIPLLHDFPAFKAPPRVPDVPYGLMTFGLESQNLMLDGPFTDAGLAALAGLDGLLGLGFFWHSKVFTGGGLAALAALPHLRYLGCQDDRCDDAAMRSIAAIPGLRMLMGQGAVAGDDGFAALGRSSSIEYFWGRGCPNLTGRGFAALAEMPALQGLGVSCARVDDASLAALPRFPALRQLMPMDVPDEGFRHVGACAGLEDLWCMYCRDTGDRATEHIAGLRLRSYYAGKTQITDRSLEILGRMDSLEKIELWEVAGVTDAGIAALARLPNLCELSVSSPNVTRTGLAALPARVRVST